MKKEACFVVFHQAQVQCADSVDYDYPLQEHATAVMSTPFTGRSCMYVYVSGVHDILSDRNRRINSATPAHSWQN